MTQVEVEAEITEMNAMLEENWLSPAAMEDAISKRERIKQMQAVIDAARVWLKRIDDLSSVHQPIIGRTERENLRAALAKLDGGTP